MSLAPRDDLQLHISLNLNQRATSEAVVASCRDLLESLDCPFQIAVSQPAATGISVVIPVFNEEETLSALSERLTDVLATLDTPYELVLVDDGSSDRTPEILRQLCIQDPSVKYIRLARNFGHQAALTAGLAHARGEAVIRPPESP